jgi:hypothetical protein
MASRRFDRALLHAADLEMIRKSAEGAWLDSARAPADLGVG